MNVIKLTSAANLLPYLKPHKENLTRILMNFVELIPLRMMMCWRHNSRAALKGVSENDEERKEK